MALNVTAVSIAPATPGGDLRYDLHCGVCLSRISWLRATPTRVQALLYGICEGAGRKMPAWCGTPRLAWRHVSTGLRYIRRPHVGPRPGVAIGPLGPTVCL